MNTNGEKKVGRFSVPIEVMNNDDLVMVRRKLLDPAKVRRIVVDGIVDPGATMLILPESMGKQLGLVEQGQVRVQYGNGRAVLRPKVGVFVTLQGRGNTFSAILEPRRSTALISTFVLDVLDFLVDPKKQKLYPRDPDFILAQIG